MPDHHMKSAVKYGNTWHIADLVPLYLYGEPGEQIQSDTGDALCWSNAATSALICTQNQAERIVNLSHTTEGDLINADAKLQAAAVLIAEGLRLKSNSRLGVTSAIILGEALKIDITRMINQLSETESKG